MIFTAEINMGDITNHGSVVTDKFINSVEYKMECQYNNKHRLWTPIKITQNMVNFKDDIIRIEKNNN